MIRAMPNTIKLAVLAGLVRGAVLGMAGTMVASDLLRAVLWAIGSTALVVATAMVALHFFRQGHDGACLARTPIQTPAT